VRISFVFWESVPAMIQNLLKIVSFFLIIFVLKAHVNEERAEKRQGWGSGLLDF